MATFAYPALISPPLKHTQSATHNISFKFTQKKVSHFTCLFSILPYHDLYVYFYGSFCFSSIIQVNNIDPKWKKLFDSAGITEKELEDEETSQFIYDFIEKHGGIDKAAEEMENLGKPPPPPPSRDDS